VKSLVEGPKSAPRGLISTAPEGAGRRTVVAAVPLVAVIVVLLLSAAQQRPSATAAVVVVLTLTTVVACLSRVEHGDRAYIALAAVVALHVGLPVTRIPHDRVVLQSVVLASLALTSVGLMDGRGSLRIRGQWIFLGLLATVTLVTLSSPDDGATKRWSVTLVAALPAFLLAGRCTASVVPRLTSTIVALAVVESIEAIVEPVLFPGHLWAAAQLGSDGRPVPLLNEVLGHGLERSQGTLGHPLPLGLLLVLAIALVLRLSSWSRLRLVPLIGLLIVGLAFAGARTSLALAVLIVTLAFARRPTFLHYVAGAWSLLLAVLVAAATGAVTLADVLSVGSTGSYTHRLGALTSFTTLASGQSTGRFLIGNGFASIPRLFDAGLLQNDGFNVVDNQFLSLLGQGGLLSSALLVALVLVALISGRRDARLAIVCVAATMLIFDVLSWPCATALCFLALGLALRPTEPG